MEPDEEILEEPTSPQVEEQKKREKAFADWLRGIQPRMFPGLIAFCVLIWLITESYGGSERADVLTRFGALSWPLLEQGEWWRLVSCGFLHIGWLHLLANMWAVYALGAFLERYYGPWRLLALFTVSVIGGSIGGVLATPLLSMAGASGGIFGWFGAIVIIYFKNRDQFTDRWRPVQWWIWQVVLLNAAIALFVPGISHAAHLAGCFTGAAFAMLMPSRPGFVETDKLWTKPLILVSLLLIPGLGMAALHAGDDPWDFGWKTFKNDKVEIQYPNTFGQTEMEIPSLLSEEKKPSSKNIVFIGLGVQVHVGTLSEKEQAAFERAKDTLLIGLPEFTMQVLKVEALRVEGESWTRFVGKSENYFIEAYIHDASQWHVIAMASESALDPFERGLRKMVETFRLVK